MAGAVDTKTVAGRRTLRFNTLDDALADLERIAAADRAGTLRHIGNWTPGQILGHVSAWIEYGYDGYPMKPPPWFVRFILRMMVKKYLKRGMPSGVRIPNAAAGTYGTAALSTSDGMRRLKAAFERLRTEPARFDSPAFGRMSHADRIALNLRHAELHLSFLQC